jgi:hypothetical protein
MNHERLQSVYRKSLAFPVPGERDGCVPPEHLEALIDARGEESDRLEALAHVMACEACRLEFELLRAVAAATPRSRISVGLSRI